MSKAALILFTSSFPFGNQENFLEQELPYLAEKFEKIVIIPHQQEETVRKIPQNVSVELTFCRYFSRPLWQQALPKIWHALKLVREIPLTLNLCKLKYHMGYAATTEIYCQFLRHYLEKNPHLLSACFYTYWFHAQTSGIALLKKRYTLPLRLISRAHGFDLYEERSPYGVIPLRHRTLKQLEALLPASDAGTNYLRNRYPHANLKTMQLGVEDSGFINPGTKKNHLTLISCSNLIPLKRVHLIIATLKALVQKDVVQCLIWHHLGDGPERQTLQQLAQKELGNSVKWTFHGRIPNEKIYSFYKTHPIDFFIHMSQTEAITVSIMEAYACGVPAMAANVGGISEIIDNTNGFLLNATPSPSKAADLLQKIAHNKGLRQKLSLQAKKTWESKFHAKTNYSHFLRQLVVCS